MDEESKQERVESKEHLEPKLFAVDHQKVKRGTCFLMSLNGLILRISYSSHSSLIELISWRVLVNVILTHFQMMCRVCGAAFLG